MSRRHNDNCKQKLVFNTNVISYDCYAEHQFLDKFVGNCLATLTWHYESLLCIATCDADLLAGFKRKKPPKIKINV